MKCKGEKKKPVKNSGLFPYCLSIITIYQILI